MPVYRSFLVLKGEYRVILRRDGDHSFLSGGGHDGVLAARREGKDRNEHEYQAFVLQDEPLKVFDRVRTREQAAPSFTEAENAPDLPHDGPKKP